MLIFGLFGLKNVFFFFLIQHIALFKERNEIKKSEKSELSFKKSESVTCYFFVKIRVIRTKTKERMPSPWFCFPLCDTFFYYFLLFGENLLSLDVKFPAGHIELCNRVTSRIKYSEIRQNFSKSAPILYSRRHSPVG